MTDREKEILTAFRQGYDAWAGFDKPIPEVDFGDESLREAYIEGFWFREEMEGY